MSPSDYTVSPASGTLNWLANDTTPKNIPVTIIGDTIQEPDETVNLTPASNPTGGAVLEPPDSPSIILNDDAAAAAGVDVEQTCY